eukprot:UN13538
MRLEYSPPPYNNGDSGTNNNSTVQNTWKERGVPPDIHVVRQQASYLQASETINAHIQIHDLFKFIIILYSFITFIVCHIYLSNT